MKYYASLKLMKEVSKKKQKKNKTMPFYLPAQTVLVTVKLKYNNTIRQSLLSQIPTQ